MKFDKFHIGKELLMKKKISSYESFILSTMILVLIFTIVRVKAQEYSESNQSLPISPLLVKKYDIDFRLDLESGKVFSVGTLIVSNIGIEETKELPIILYKDLKVESVKCQDGRFLDFTQDIIFFPDDPSYDVNYILVKLNKIIVPGEERTFFISYSGTIDESHNSDGYVKDSINPEFSYLRTETNAYPMVCYPNYKNRRKTFEHFWTRHPFDYRIKITVPHGYVVANIGCLVEKKETEEGIQYTYENILGAWRMDIMVAKYACLENPESGIKMFCFPQDLETAKKAFEYQQKAYKIFKKWFGPLKNATGFTIIQTPGWDGGQSDVTGVIQSGRIDIRAFPGYAHEIAHFWGPNTPEKFRWINEGQASYLQYRLLKELGDEKGFEKGMSKRRKAFMDYIEKYPEARRLTLDDYVEKGKGRHDHVMNYHKGAWVYFLLDSILGEEAFNRIIACLYNDYEARLVTNEEFIQYVEKVSGKNLSEFWKDWIYGSESTEILLSGHSSEDIINKYF